MGSIDLSEPDRSCSTHHCLFGESKRSYSTRHTLTGVFLAVPVTVRQTSEGLGLGDTQSSDSSRPDHAANAAPLRVPAAQPAHRARETLGEFGQGFGQHGSDYFASALSIATIGGPKVAMYPPAAPSMMLRNEDRDSRITPLLGLGDAACARNVATSASNSA